MKYLLLAFLSLTIRMAYCNEIIVESFVIESASTKKLPLTPNDLFNDSNYRVTRGSKFTISKGSPATIRFESVPKAELQIKPNQVTNNGFEYEATTAFLKSENVSVVVQQPNGQCALDSLVILKYPYQESGKNFYIGFTATAAEQGAAANP